jgi:hypothetical protein
VDLGGIIDNGVGMVWEVVARYALRRTVTCRNKNSELISEDWTRQ